MANQADFPVRTLCRMLKVSTSGFYAWQDRPPSQRSIDDAVLSERIRVIHAASDEIYGSPNIHAELRDEGTRVGRKRVARLMRRAGLRGVSRRRSFVVTTRRDPKQRPAPDLVNRKFTADGPNQLWVADMTYVPTWAGFIYLAIVLDVWSRRVVGWAIGEQMTADLVLAALNMAMTQRKPTEVIHHSETGTYGAGLLRHLQNSGVEVLEVTTPDKSDRRRRGKDDDLDAQNAAHAAFAGKRTVTPRNRDGMIESLRVLRVCRKTAVAARRVALQLIHNTIVCAPDDLRDALRNLTRMQLVRTLAAWRPDLTDYRNVASAYRIALKSLGRRYLELHDEIADLDAMIGAIVDELAPELAVTGRRSAYCRCFPRPNR